MNNEISYKESTKKEKDYVLKKLIEYNEKMVPFTQKKVIDLNFVAKHRNEIIGGINAILYSWKMLFVDILWVDEAYRGQRIGTGLIKKVEEEAKKQGCTLIHLDTFDFQAKDFYLKHGFEIFGVLDDCPPGHQRFYLKKKI